MSIQRQTILHKMQLFIAALAEQVSDNDEAIAAHGRTPSALSHGAGFDYVAPAWLSYYRGTGTGAPWQHELCDRLEQAQAGYWRDEFPERPPLHSSGRSHRWQSEAHEWLDAALDDEVIYLTLEIALRDDTVTIRAGFGDEINHPLATQFERDISTGEWLAMSDDTAQALIDEIETAIYTATE